MHCTCNFICGLSDVIIKTFSQSVRYCWLIRTDKEEYGKRRCSDVHSFVHFSAQISDSSPAFMRVRLNTIIRILHMQEISTNLLSTPMPIADLYSTRKAYNALCTLVEREKKRFQVAANTVSGT